MKKTYPRVENALKRLVEGDESARTELSRLGQMGGRRSGEVRRAKKFAELEIKEELELIEKERLLAGVEEKLRQANEIEFFLD